MKLDTYLRQSGLTQSEFARRLGLRTARLNAYVKGQRRPSIEVVAAIEEATGGMVMAGDLLNGSAEPPYQPPSEAEREKIRAGIAEAQRIVRLYVPASVSLVDELIAERRAEAAREG